MRRCGQLNTVADFDNVAAQCSRERCLRRLKVLLAEGSIALLHHEPVTKSRRIHTDLVLLVRPHRYATLSKTLFLKQYTRLCARAVLTQVWTGPPFCVADPAHDSLPLPALSGTCAPLLVSPLALPPQDREQS